MKPTSTKPESERRERQDWLIVLLILLLGFICVIVAGQRALLFSPNWKLPANMESGINPNSNFQTQPGGFVEPIDPGILTQPAWVKVFLTPGAKFATGTPPPAGAEAVKDTPTSAGAATAAAVTNTLPAITLTNTTAPTSTFVWLPPPAEATWTPKPKKTQAPPPDTAVPPTDTPLPMIDLEITMNDGGVVYPPGGNLVYTVVVRNNSAYDVTGATVSDLFGAQITGASWTCSASIPTATCTNGSGNPFTDTVNLPAGSFVTYTVTTNVSGFSAGPLSNTATVSIVPFETDPGDNTISITTAGPGAAGGQVTIGPGNGNPPFLNLGVGNPTSIQIAIPAITADGTGSYDFVFYERYLGTNIELDRITIELSADGSSWTPVFIWGDGDSSNNGSIGASYCPVTEDDNCVIPSTSLYNGTGIPIDIDSFGLHGSYSWIRLTAPDPAPGDGADVDAIQPYYP